MTQHETPYVMPTAELSNTNRGSTKPDLSAGGIAVELGDVGYIYNGTLVKLFNALKGAGDMNNCHGLPSGHNLCIVDEIPYSMPLIDIPSKVAGVGDMKFTAGQEVERTERQDTSHAYGNTASGKGVIEEKRFAEYLQKNSGSWLTFAAELGHNVPPSGLVFVTGCDQTLACAASVSSGNSTELNFFVSTGGNAKGSAGLWEGWESIDSFAIKNRPQGSDSLGPKSILSYASSLLYDAATAMFSFALQWPSDQQAISPNQPAFMHLENKVSWLHPKLLVQPSEAYIGTKRDSNIFHEREGTITQGTNLEQGHPLSGSGTQATPYDDNTLRMPQDVEDSDLDDELERTPQTYEERQEGLPMEELMSFIFENSTAERALVHDNDLISLSQNNPDQGTHTFRSWIHNLRPQIYVDENVGMFEYTHNLKTCPFAAMADCSLPDITESIHRDSPNLFSIDCGPVWDVFGATYNVVDTSIGQEDGLNVVIKVLTGTSDQKEEIEQRLKPELARWHNLKHPNVTELLGVARLHPERPLGSVTKRVDNPDLLTYIGIHPELKLDKAKEIVDGIQYLHDQGVIHGDLKVDNVVIANDGQAQISDFGIAQILDPSSFMTLTQCNTRFTAPELMPVKETDLSDVRPTRESDVFSLGMLLLQLFHGPDEKPRRGLPYNHIPSSSGYDIGMVKCIHAGERPQRTRYNQMEDKHWNLMYSCWDSEPSQRPTIAQVRHAL